MQVQHSIDVTYESTNDAKTAEKWLNQLPDLFAADFEAALRYSADVIADAKLKMLDTSIPKKERIYYQALAKLVEEISKISKESLQLVGRNGFEYYKANFTKQYCIDNLCKLMDGE